MNIRRLLIIQTAFIGDVVLTLPVAQRVHRVFPHCEIAFLAIPSAAPLLDNRSDIQRVIHYDKRRRQRGLQGFLEIVRLIRKESYDLAIIPHRSVRSAAIAAAARIPRRIGFDSSTGKFLLTDAVHYRNTVHEIERNLDLLNPLGIPTDPRELPVLYPNAEDENVVDHALMEGSSAGGHTLIAVAPGSVWATKRWPAERYAELCRLLEDHGYGVVLIGGEGDSRLNAEVAARSKAHSINLTGKLTLLQSAALLRRCALLVTNDSAPQHIAVAVKTPVVAIFGATVPAFGFAPVGPLDIVVETHGLACRPCAIHGGDHCPIHTFACMLQISAQKVFETLRSTLQQSGVSSNS